MKRKTILLFATAFFAVLFIARFSYELNRQDGPVYGGFMPAGAAFQEYAQNEAPVSLSTRNYASAKIIVDQASAPQTVEQKYERVSNINTRTRDWDADIAALQKAISETGALVQREDASGLVGARFLALSLGVVPAAFDGAVEKLKTVGKLVSINTVKTDRTSDFRALEAKRRSLEKTRDGLSALRNDGAALADRIDLETRILEIEGQIQELGVNLGDFSELNSFCTVHISVREAAKRDLWHLIVSAALDALAWTTALFFGLVFSLLCVLGIAALGMWLYDRLKKKALV